MSALHSAAGRLLDDSPRGTVIQVVAQGRLLASWVHGPDSGLWQSQQDPRARLGSEGLAAVLDGWQQPEVHAFPIPPRLPWWRQVLRGL